MLPGSKIRGKVPMYPSLTFNDCIAHPIGLAFKDAVHSVMIEAVGSLL